ncbi:hypothetical protein, partial [Sphingobacterium suaedae]
KPSQIRHKGFRYNGRLLIFEKTDFLIRVPKPSFQNILFQFGQAFKNKVYNSLHPLYGAIGLKFHSTNSNFKSI